MKQGACELDSGAHGIGRSSRLEGAQESCDKRAFPQNDKTLKTMPGARDGGSVAHDDRHARPIALRHHEALDRAVR
eukprot:CAMPEP_0113840452 /NCGR_PEP_ID=MMETSP0328-20130328/11629_1 /TAXON_ID=39455 /ORGANISM="Alexandrium minutum" /LENGTH=75 /DNA_ID=CAMNT_0000809151 /DNA_START=56 /DNA_END=280 /DNA_ORIENTATION=- /assembly_acc=CAM_ASM_000350